MNLFKKNGYRIRVYLKGEIKVCGFKSDWFDVGDYGDLKLQQDLAERWIMSGCIFINKSDTDEHAVIPISNVERIEFIGYKKANEHLENRDTDLDTRFKKFLRDTKLEQ
jgi:hypothetical protein